MDHNSWVTQRCANKLPPWSDARKLPHSTVQQILNPIGVELEELYKYSINKTSSFYLTTADLDELDVVYTLCLPPEMNLGIDVNNLANPMYITPRCKVTTDTQTIWLTIAKDNNIQSFWYDALPDRIESTSTTCTVASVLSETSFENLHSASFSDVCHSTRLAVIIASCTNFVDPSKSQPYSFIVLHGTTERDVEETELMVIPYNGTFLTKKIWKDITDVEYYGLEPETGTVQIDCFTFNSERQVDKYQLYVDTSIEKLLYHKLGTKTSSGGDWSVHQHLTVSADTLGELYSGNDALQVVKEIELLYESATLNLNDIAVQPFTGRIFAIDNDYLYIFSPHDSLATKRGLKDRDPGAKMSIEVDEGFHYVRGDTISFKPIWRMPTERVYCNRWSIKKPDGSVVYLDILGEVVNASDAWIFNKTSSELIFGPFKSPYGDRARQDFSYTLTNRGTYQIILETKYADDTTEKDIVTVQAHYKEADVRISLPTALKNSTGVAFDADQKLWFLKSTTATMSHLIYDIYMIDFERKMIFLREDYGTVTVFESADRMIEK